MNEWKESDTEGANNIRGTAYAIRGVAIINYYEYSAKYPH